MMKAFLTSIKKKENNKFCSFVHIRKFHDAVLVGSEEADGVIQSEEYQTEMESYLASCKIELAVQ